MKTAYYFRSEVLNFWDLNEVLQKEALNNSNDDEHARERQYVYDRQRGDLLPLDMFIRINSKTWDGTYGMTYFSSYFIKIGRTGDEATVAYKNW